MGYTQKLGLLAQSVFQDSSLNVGIGAAPSGTYKFEVTGTAKVSSTLLVSGAATFSSSITALSGLINGTTDAFFDINRSASGNAGRVRFQTAGTDEFEIGLKGGVAGLHITKGDATELLTVLTTGNVGIGTTSTAYRLAVVTSGGAGLYISTSGSTFGNPSIAMINGATDTTIAATTNGLEISTYSSHAMLFRTATVERMRITSGGNVCMNTTSGSSILNVVGNAGAYTCSLQASTTSGQSYGLIINGGSTSGDYTLYVRNAAQGSPYIYIRGDGYLYSASAWSGSDKRLKENITDLDNGLDKVLNLKPRKFDFIDSFKNQFGFIAQEVQEVIPDAVSVFQEEDQMLAIKMDFIVPHLVKAIQELNQQNQDLKSRLDKAGL